jgi:uroporphyrinogen-III synthase
VTRPLVLVTRPQPEAEETAAHLHRLGYDPILEPMLRIAPLEGPPLDLSGAQALLVTSRNGARALARRTERRDLSLFAVGQATAEALRALGFSAVQDAAGAAGDLVELVRRRCQPGRGRLLHIRGDAVAADPAVPLRAAGFTVDPVILYGTTTPSAFSGQLERTMRQRGLAYALFFSPRTARTFVTLARAAGLGPECAGIEACALSAAVASALQGVPWSAVRVSVRPEQDSLLALLPRQGIAKRSRGDHGQ